MHHRFRQTGEGGLSLLNNLQTPTRQPKVCKLNSSEGLFILLTCLVVNASWELFSSVAFLYRVIWLSHSMMVDFSIESILKIEKRVNESEEFCSLGWG